jgi:hypothetical protein
VSFEPILSIITSRVGDLGDHGGPATMIVQWIQEIILRWPGIRGSASSVDHGRVTVSVYRAWL